MQANKSLFLLLQLERRLPAAQHSVERYSSIVSSKTIVHKLTHAPGTKQRETLNVPSGTLLASFAVPSPMPARRRSDVDRESAAECLMRSGIRFWGATTITLVASGAANSADLEPAVQLRPALWSWSGGYIGGHAGGGYGQQSLSNPCGPSDFGGGVDTPVFLAGGQIGYNWQKNSWVFGLKRKASSAVSKGTNTRLAASGIVLCANARRVQTSLSPEPVASLTPLARRATRWPTSRQA
ncbi:hypothetical protein ACVWZR_001857 [Bradyrhizobium sp. i1.3.1]